MLQRLRVLQQASLTGRPVRLMPRLFLSGAVEASSLHLLKHLGITHILNATEVSRVRLCVCVWWWCVYVWRGDIGTLCMLLRGALWVVRLCLRPTLLPSPQRKALFHTNMPHTSAPPPHTPPPHPPRTCCSPRTTTVL
jgi:hypothetical protein